jgi:hypothetical protein
VRLSRGRHTRTERADIWWHAPPGSSQRYRPEPVAGADALYLEAVSLAFNDRVCLLAKGRIIDALRQASLTEVIRRYQDRIDTTEHGLYEVQRVARPRASTATLIACRVRRLDHGSPSAMRRDGSLVLNECGGASETS